MEYTGGEGKKGREWNKNKEEEDRRRKKEKGKMRVKEGRKGGANNTRKRKDLREM